MDKVINIEELQQDQHNFNKGTEEGQRLMEKSFQEHGAGRSILIDKDGKIIAGNKSQKAAIAAGIQKVRVIETDGTELVAVKRTDVSLDSTEGRKLALLDNLTTQVNLSWDQAELQTVQTELEDFDPDSYGFDIGDISTADPDEADKVTEDDFDPDAQFETKVNPGEVWQLGEHRLMCGDSTKKEDVAKLMMGEQADLWLTDPPYNVDYEGHAKYLKDSGRPVASTGKIMNDFMDEETFFNFLFDAFTSAKENMKAGCAFYIWHSDAHGLTFRQATHQVGLKVRQCLIWNKSSITIGHNDYQWKHEPCLYGWKDGAAHYFVDARNRATVISDEKEIDIDKMKKDEMKKLLHEIFDEKISTTIINCPKPQRSEDHPTMKPVRLFGQQIANSSRPGQIVLDTFGGSGTTIVAAEQLGRKARLMELDPHYCNVIIARWEKLTGGKAQKIE